MSIYILFNFIVLSSASAQAQTQKAYGNRGPIVLELYTSTGCPACPAADRNFDELTARPDVIALACHVTYFDRGRKDPASRSFCNARQGVYKLSLNTGGLFTPMTVIDGRDFQTGRDFQELHQALRNTGQNHINKRIDLKKSGQYMEIRLPPARLKQKAEVWLIEYRSGENIVTDITKLMNWDGRGTLLGSPVKPAREYAVIAQDYKTGTVASGKTGP